jgi:hypothetical protein
MARTVEQVCQDCLGHDNLVAGCNEFVLAVVATFNPAALSPGDMANGILTGRLKSSPWIWIGEKPDEATRQAASGNLVLGGLTSTEMSFTDKKGKQHVASMGHIVVVTPGGPSLPGEITLTDGTTQPCRGGYPYCYQGAYNKLYRFKDRTQVDAVFPGALLQLVHYAYLNIKGDR